MRHIFKWNRKWQKLLRLCILLPILTIACSELADWIACNVATHPPNGKSCVVLVLGYPSHSDGTPDRVQQVRVATGVQAYRHYNCDRLVFSGAAVKNQIVEAQTMAQLARGSGIQSDRISLETQARTTWENIKFSIPSLAKSDRILMASDSLHAQRGRRYLCKQRPDLCARTFVAVEYRPFERSGWKIVSACYELFAWGRDSIVF
jgi:vancomycin permeability regulator SanA